MAYLSDMTFNEANEILHIKYSNNENSNTPIIDIREINFYNIQEKVKE